jgi:hypothetical protein
MQLQITVRGDDSLATMSLFRWLVRDPDSRRDVAVSLDADAPEGSMGSLDVINAILTQATSIASLAVAIASWRDSRSKPASIKLMIGKRSLNVEGDANSITHAISELLSDPDS